MKYAIVCLVIMLYRCTDGTNNKMLEGTYVTHYENEYGVYDDTLILRKANEKSIFQLTKNIGATRRLDNKVFPKEWRTENWMLEYNAEKQSFFELRRGKTLVWNNSNSTLQIGNLIYRKIR